ncbi:MAG TPA: cysteine hydrolase [Mesorhizobium sp.]|uniref:cysteine hydrolase family protein n=1 Tax=Mesorhizobium sp. TaxID=1871066 RepID=UPI002DDC9936|nr:cysteine hydrolase [Mesorhizobium sp.]HEV2502411.1 cysteine hydrolase [Mesorhizobium sp.]
MISLNTRPEPVGIVPERTAAIVVDMQNAFVSKGGMFDLAGVDISNAPAVVEANRRLLTACRSAGVRIVYLQMSYRDDLSDAGDVSSPNYHKELGITTMRKRPELGSKLLVDGTWDWQIVDALSPGPDDWLVRKSRYSGFCGTDLEQRLRNADIRHLLFTGVATNVCVESTARDAFFAEFWPLLVEDAVNHSGPDFNRQAAVWNFENVFGWVTDSNHVIAALEAAT